MVSPSHAQANWDTADCKAASTALGRCDLMRPFRERPVCKIERDSGRSSRLLQLELVPAEKLDRVLHAHHT
jgi:hypothetical protein